ncbi:DNA repair protein RAD50-like isoform X3 [Aphis craccivora]|uniref:DNA repair protein RAD50-like isoform X3 n=1 Tax=Aphis craccivora TaxID=307492 RepID=A0A6G0YFU9_APHCR|nr:DNA repair protein RAD50-like isoform X3 [Aphis craccivora]
MNVKSKHFPTVFKKIEKNKNKVTENGNVLRKTSFRSNRFFFMVGTQKLNIHKSSPSFKILWFETKFPKGITKDITSHVLKPTIHDRQDDVTDEFVNTTIGYPLNKKHFSKIEKKNNPKIVLLNENQSELLKTVKNDFEGKTKHKTTSSIQISRTMSITQIYILLSKLNQPINKRYSSYNDTDNISGESPNSDSLQE